MKVIRKKGAALIIVMMVMLVLSILGASFLGISEYQNNEAIREDKGMQAYYLARAGAEAALQAWQKASSTAKPTGAFDIVYLNSANNFVNSPTDAKGQFDVSITPNGTSNVIHSTGKVGNVEKDVTVTINTVTSVIPGPLPSYTDGATTGFYDFTSGQINPGTWPAGGNSGTVKNEGKNGKGLKLVNKNKGSAQLTFEKILFSSPVQVLHDAIILVSNVIVFTKPVDFSLNGDSKGNLTLKVYGSTNGATPITRTVSGVTSNWGVVVFEGKGYYYKDLPGGVIIKNQSDIDLNIAAGYMEHITDPNVLNGYLSGVVPTSLTVTSYSILWSK